MYTNWFDDGFVHSNCNGCNRDYANNVKTWLDFVAAIGEENKKKFPIREQQKNDCTVMSAISAYEVQNRKRWIKDVSKVAAIKQTIEKRPTYKIQSGDVDEKSPTTSRPRPFVYR